MATKVGGVGRGAEQKHRCTVGRSWVTRQATNHSDTAPRQSCCLGTHAGRQPRPRVGFDPDAAQPARRAGDRTRADRDQGSLQALRSRAAHRRRPVRMSDDTAAKPNTRRDGAATTKYCARACFTTSPKATTTWMTCEVKLYLAVPSPSPSLRPLAGPISGPSSVLRQARSGPAFAPL